MKKENRYPIYIVLFLIAILVIGIIWNQPMSQDEAIAFAKESVSDEFTQVDHTEFIPADQSDVLRDIWIIELASDEEDRRIQLVIDAYKGNIIEEEWLE